jgi:hypothetical protein
MAEIKPPVKKEIKRQKETIDFPFSRENYILMLACIAVVIIGFMLMSGGGEDPVKYDPTIFSTRRIIIAPIVVIIGFIIGFAAIMRKPKG